MWIPKFLVNMFGHKIADELKLEEGAMPTKSWYKSKTIWVAAVSAMIGIYNSIAQVKGLPPIPELVYTLLGAIGVYTRSTADTKITA